ncbi:hypothetical protein KL941_004034 [Ogataea angusta]|nr:hypothetical protein KL941_004034 [Ogataea angusta]
MFAISRAVREVQKLYEQLSGRKIEKVLDFKPRVRFPDYNVPLTDFQGHQVTALKRMRKLAPEIDLVIELRDARAPITTTNFLLDRIFKGKQKIVLYTKAEKSLINQKIIKKWNVRNESWSFFDKKRYDHTAKVANMITEKYNLMHPPPPLGMKVIVAGMPNVGKSTLVNKLRRKLAIEQGKKKDVAKVERGGGTTRVTSEMIKISEDPLIYIYDTPGVLMPTVANSKAMLTHALLRTVDNTTVDPIIAADYLLYVWNLLSPDGFFYRSYTKTPTNDIQYLLECVARKKMYTKNKVSKTRPSASPNGYDLKAAALALQEQLRLEQTNRLAFDLDMMRDLSKKEIGEIIEAERKRVGEMEMEYLE